MNIFDHFLLCDTWSLLETSVTNIIQIAHVREKSKLQPFTVTSHMQAVSIKYQKDRFWVEYHFKTEVR